MATKGPEPTYTETCTQCGAVIPVSETMFVDGVNKLCPEAAMRYSRLLFATVLLVASTVAASADTFTYTYTGHDFTDVTAPYTTSDFVSGSFTVAAPIAADEDVNFNVVQPISFSFFDGVQTIDSNNASRGDFLIGTDSSGAIEAWGITAQIVVDQSSKEIQSESASGGTGFLDLGNNLVGRGRNTTDPGMWVETVNSSATPEDPN